MLNLMMYGCVLLKRLYLGGGAGLMMGRNGDERRAAGAIGHMGCESCRFAGLCFWVVCFVAAQCYTIPHYRLRLCS